MNAYFTDTGRNQRSHLRVASETENEKEEEQLGACCFTSDAAKDREKMMSHLSDLDASEVEKVLERGEDTVD